MTITTANWPQTRALRRNRLPAALRLAPLALGALLLSAECRADFKLRPGFDLSETYSDNLWLDPDGLAQHEFVTDASPSLTLTNNGRRLKLNASAQWHLFGYDNKGFRDNGGAIGADPLSSPYLTRTQPKSTHAYQVQALAVLVDEFLFLDTHAERQRQPISAFAPVSSNEFSSVNRDDISSWSISPYLRHRFGSTAILDARFSRDAVRGGSAGFGDSMASNRSVQLSSADGSAISGAGSLQSGGAGMMGANGNGAQGSLAGGRPAMSGNRFGWTLTYESQDLDTEQLQPGQGTQRTSYRVAMANVRWNVLPHLGLTANTGYDRYTYEALLGTTSGKRWSIGAIWTPSSRTSAQVSFGRRYFGKTALLSLNHRTRNTVWSLDYNDEVTTTRSQFLLPASIDTAGMLDRLLLAQFPDPVQRQQAVQAYMASSGLPTSMADSINFLSNRYFRDKRLLASVVWRLSKTSLSLSAYRDKREALSVQQSDSVLLGNQLASLNDNISQRGASASVSYTLSSRSSLTGGVDTSSSHSLSTGIDNSQHAMRLGLSRRFGTRALGNLLVRHASGNLAFGGGGHYHENAVVANFTVKY